MDIYFNQNLINQYNNRSQIARVLTENWVTDNLYCPRCGFERLSHHSNNSPVADFFCPQCQTQFELKSKNGPFGRKITDGAYETFIKRITSNQNPDFFFMSYSWEEKAVNDFYMIPKHFFVPQIIEKRKPLSSNARKAGWTGCNIIIKEIPENVKVFLIKNRNFISKELVVKRMKKLSAFVVTDLKARGWILDVLLCVNKISSDIFSLQDVYQYEKELQIKHPNNQNIQAKIRQQLQVLRDHGIIEFVERGIYRKIK